MDLNLRLSTRLHGAGCNGAAATDAQFSLYAILCHYRRRSSVEREGPRGNRMNRDGCSAPGRNAAPNEQRAYGFPECPLFMVEAGAVYRQ